MSFSRSKRLPLVASCVCILAGVAWADQIVLKNGDRVTGSIVKKDGKTLTIKTEHFGVVTTIGTRSRRLPRTSPSTSFSGR